MAQNANQQKGFLVLSGLFSEASSFHPVITQVLTEAQSWEMGLFVSYLPGYRNFYRKVPSFLGSILWGVFDVNSPKKQGRRKFSLKKKKEDEDSKNRIRKGQKRGKSLAVIIADQENFPNEKSIPPRDST